MKHAFVLLGTLGLGVATALSTNVAYAEDVDKGDAKALLASGLKLFAAKDYLGALSVFETAYERYPSPKILLNIGTTLLKLDRKVDAANIYQRYLDAKDVDEKKQADAKKILAGLDKELGLLDISVTPENAEVQIGTGTWVSIDSVRKARVAPGEVTLLARAPRYKLRAETFSITKGETRSVALTLEEEPAGTSSTTTTTTTTTTGGVAARVTPEQRSRLAAMVAWHVDPLNGTDVFPVGSTVLVGASYDVMPSLSVQGAALLGAYFGPYVGATYTFLDGKLRPLVSAGVPILITNGARISVRGAAGLELVVNRHVAFALEVGVERFVNPEDDIMNKTLFVPSLGMTGRL
ncbi:MAG: hypothetical protein ACKV2T_11780 [Kofleriaceae bacterium]